MSKVKSSRAKSGDVWVPENSVVPAIRPSVSFSKANISPPSLLREDVRAQQEVEAHIVIISR